VLGLSVTSRLLVLNLQLIHHCCTLELLMRPFDPCAPGLRINLAVQCHDAILYVVFNTFFEPVLNESSVQIFSIALSRSELTVLAFFRQLAESPNLV